MENMKNFVEQFQYMDASKNREAMMKLLFVEAPSRLSLERKAKLLPASFYAEENLSKPKPQPKPQPQRGEKPKRLHRKKPLVLVAVEPTLAPVEPAQVEVGPMPVESEATQVELGPMPVESVDAPAYEGEKEEPEEEPVFDEEKARIFRAAENKELASQLERKRLDADVMASTLREINAAHELAKARRALDREARADEQAALDAKVASEIAIIQAKAAAEIAVMRARA